MGRIMVETPALGTGRGATLHTTAEAHSYLTAALHDGLQAAGPEAAIANVTGTVVNLLGDHQAHLKPGALVGEERQFSVSGFFMLSADRSNVVMIGSQNFPTEQYRLTVKSDYAHPGQVVESGKPLILENTDDDAGFRQILKTSRMGSSIYAPMLWQGQVLGMLICGAQARYTYRPIDLEILEQFAEVALALWLASGGPDNLDEILGQSRPN